jgi:hypothetical protein
MNCTKEYNTSRHTVLVDQGVGMLVCMMSAPFFCSFALY